MAKNLVKLNINGTDYDQRPYVVCDTSRESVQKPIIIPDFTLVDGATIIVKFTDGFNGRTPELILNGIPKPIFKNPVEPLVLSFIGQVIMELRYDISSANNNGAWIVLNTNVLTQADWNNNDARSPQFIHNKPTIPTLPIWGEGLTYDSETNTLTGSTQYTLPTASSTTVGGVKVGSTLRIEDGVLDIKDYKKVTIDASSLDEDTWYPVTFKLTRGKYTKIACIVNLNGGVPSWSTNVNGFAVLKVWESIGREYGIYNSDSRVIYASQCTWVKKDANNMYIDPVRGVGQLTNSSNEYVYVRGGGKYHFFINDNAVTVQLHTSDYTASNQTINIKTMDNIPDVMFDFDSRMVKHPYNTSVGNSSTPVYINQYGNAVECSSISSSATKVTNSGSLGKWYYPLHVSGLDETASYTNYVNSGFTVYTLNADSTNFGDVTLTIGEAATDTVKTKKGHLRIYGESNSVIFYGPKGTDGADYHIYLPSEAGTLVVKNSSGTASCNISGSSGSCTGNAATATTATNANNININTSTSSSYYPMTFVTTASAGNTKLYIGGSTGTTSTGDGIRYNPSAKTCYCSGGFYEASDERLKNFSNDIEVDLDKLSKLSKKYFTWKDDESNAQHIGVSAQEVQAIYPELVEVIDEEGHLSVSYDKLSVVALKGIDILNDKIKSLEERLERLEKIIEG